MSAMYVQDITNRTNQAASVSLSASHTKTSITPFQKVLEKENALYAAASEENTALSYPVPPAHCLAAQLPSAQ